VSFKDADTKATFHRRAFRRIPPDVRTRAQRIFDMLNAAAAVEDLKVPPSNHLEAPRGVREGQHSIRINGQRRLCFRFEAGSACDVVEAGSVYKVEIVDNHSVAPAEPSPHPLGEMLLEEFMIPRGMSQADLARQLGKTAAAINELVPGKRGVSAEMALLLADLLGTTADSWMNLQGAWKLWHARRRLRNM
jgi:addiction module HigA family antidote